MTDPNPQARLDALVRSLPSDDYILRGAVERWTAWARVRRPDQAVPPGKWLYWVILSGRGWGKTRVGAETIRAFILHGIAKRIHCVGRTAADVRDTMVEGESGLLAVCSGDEGIGMAPSYTPARRKIRWPNGAQVLLFSAEEPDTLRGPQCDAYWADEVASWNYPQETWDMLQMGARLGQWVRGIVTTTPRPIGLVKHLVQSPDSVVVRGSTYDNLANLAESTRKAILDRYEGTRLGRQELHGEILDDNPAALWRRGTIDDHRVPEAPKSLSRVVVAVDPAATCTEDSDETGIVVAASGSDGHFYVLADASVRATPLEWARRATAAFVDYRADRLVYETNQGGDMVAQTLRTADAEVALQPVHASRGKAVRAEPIAALYEQGRVHHVGTFTDLEDQLCSWEPGGPSPDRLDALVWALTALSTRGSLTVLDRALFGR